MSEKFNTPIVNEILNKAEEDKAMVENNKNNNVTVNDVKNEEVSKMTDQERINAATQEVMNEMNKEDDVMKTAANTNKAMNGVKEEVKGKKTFTLNDVQEKFSNGMKSVIDALSPALVRLDEVLGFSSLKDEIVNIIIDCDKSVKGFDSMVTDCEKAIRDAIEILEMVDPDDEFKKIAFLRTYVGESKDSQYVSQSIFENFAKIMKWLAKKATRRINKFFDDKIEKAELEPTTFNKFVAGTCSALKSIFNVGGKIIHFTGSLLITATSYLFAAIVKATVFIVEAVKSVIGWAIKKGKELGVKAKEFINKEKDFELDDDDDFDDDIVFEEA